MERVIWNSNSFGLLCDYMVIWNSLAESVKIISNYEMKVMPYKDPVFRHGSLL